MHENLIFNLKLESIKRIKMFYVQSKYVWIVWRKKFCSLFTPWKFNQIASMTRTIFWGVSVHSFTFNNQSHSSLTWLKFDIRYVHFPIHRSPHKTSTTRKVDTDSKLMQCYNTTEKNRKMFQLLKIMWEETQTKWLDMN